VVFAVGWVGFDSEFESGGILVVNCFDNFLVADSLNVKNIRFSTNTPRPETVAVTV
jgi:hypothetical protein